MFQIYRVDWVISSRDHGDFEEKETGDHRSDMMLEVDAGEEE